LRGPITKERNRTEKAIYFENSLTPKLTRRYSRPAVNIEHSWGFGKIDSTFLVCYSTKFAGQLSILGYAFMLECQEG